MRQYFSAKDLAQLMGVSTRTVKRTAKTFDVPPTVQHNACLRWRYDDAYRLLKAWERGNTKPQSTNGH